MSKLHYRYRDVQERVDALYEHGITRGVYLGFESLHEYYSFKPAATTYFYGAPFSGKSELVFELLINLSELYDQRHAIYSPESGEAHDIFAELLSKRLRKPFFRNLPDHMTEVEYLREKDWVDDHFYIIDPKDKDLTIEKFYTTVTELEKEYGVKIDTTCCDPFNELEHDFSANSGRQDLYIENRLGFIRRDAVAHHRHNIVITHIADQEPVKTKDGMVYYPPPTPRQIAGGQAWYRKGMNMIAVWRPPGNMTDTETGLPYEENEVHLIIQKFKPKGVGKRGTVKLYYDTRMNRYYEKFNGTKRYAGKPSPLPATQMKITPNYEF